MFDCYEIVSYLLLYSFKKFYFCVMKHLFFVFVWLPQILFCQSNLQLAIQLFEQADYSEAQKIFIQEQKKNPNSEVVLKYLGEIAGHNKEWQEAQGYFEKLKVINPNKADYYFKYGGALAMRVQKSSSLFAVYHLEEMIENFEKAIELNPKHIEARWALIEVYLQTPTIVGGSEAKAQAYANELLRISEVDGYLSKGHISEYFKRYTEAELYFKKAIEVSGGSKNSYKRLINLYKNKMRQPEKANQIQQESNKKHP